MTGQQRPSDRLNGGRNNMWIPAKSTYDVLGLITQIPPGMLEQDYQLNAERKAKKIYFY